MPKHRTSKLPEWEKPLSREEQKLEARDNPTRCPVCGSESVAPVLPNRLVQLRDGQVAARPFAYRCGKGHVFLSARQ